MILIFRINFHELKSKTFNLSGTRDLAYGVRWLRQRFSARTVPEVSSLCSSSEESET